MTREEIIQALKKEKRTALHENKAAFDMAIKVIEQEPKTGIALDRYKDLQDYFGDEAIAKTILEKQIEFKAWLERLRWNTKKVDELARKLEALEQEPCEDAISRQAVLDMMQMKMGGEELYKAVYNLPPVIPAHKKGKWIGHGEHCENLGVIPSGLGAYEWCSNCDCGIDVREWHRNHYNYCPNCGAEMESEE